MFQLTQPQQNPLRRAIAAACRRDEAQAVAEMFERGYLAEDEREQAHSGAWKLSEKIRAKWEKMSGAAALLHQFDGAAPTARPFLAAVQTLPTMTDEATILAFLQDKLSSGDWSEYWKHGQSRLENMALFRKNVQIDANLDVQEQADVLRQAHKKTEQLIDLLAENFIFAEQLDDATIKAARKWEKAGYSVNYQLAYQAAYTQEEAEWHFQQYVNAIYTVGRASKQV